MAGNKKDIAEEAQGLEDIPEIPREEQPYPLPEGWKWVRLGNITKIIGGGTPPSKKQEYYQNGDIPWITPADLSGYKDIYISRGSRMITKAGLMNSSARMLPTDTVCLSSRAPIGYVAIAENPISTNQGFKNFLPSPLYYSRFLYWYLKDNKSFLESYASGTTFLEISGERASQILFPLPPLETQHHIVNRIESLFSKLDEAAEEVQAVIDSHEARRQAILHKAFSGELTKKWREENGVSLDSWQDKTLQDVCVIPITDGTHQTPKYTAPEVGIPFLSSKDVTKEYIDWNSIKYITKELHEILYKRIAPQKGDILLAKNGTTGVAAIVKDTRIFDIYVTLALLRPNKKIVNENYLLRIINSYLCKKQFNSKLTGIGLPNLHLRDIKEVIIPVPSLNEQNKIISVISPILRNLDKNLNMTIEILDRINLLKKFILSYMFMGVSIPHCLGSADTKERHSQRHADE